MTGIATNSTLLQGSSFDASLSPYLSPLEDLDVNTDFFHKPIKFAVPRSRVSRVEVITNVLETLKKEKLAVLDFLLDVLNQSYLSNHAPSYNSDKFKDLRFFWESERGSSVMKEWLRLHAVHLVRDQIQSEMECTKPYLRNCPRKM